MLITGETGCWVYGNSLHYLLKFSVNLKLFEEIKALFFRSTLQVQNDFIHSRPKLETIQVTIHKKMDKQPGHSCNGTLLSCKKEWAINTIKGIMLSERNITEKSTYHNISFVWNSKTDKNNSEWKKFRMVVASGGWGWELSRKGAWGNYLGHW